MAVIPPRDLAAAASVSDTDVLIVDKGSSVEKALPSQIVDAAIPLASQAEAEAGTDNAKRVTPLRVKQAIDAIGVSADSLAEGLATKVATADLASTDDGKGAELVAYKAPGTGAVSRDTSGKLQETVSVLDYGAVGDAVKSITGVATASDATFTDANAAWTTDDIGKMIVIGKAGAAGAHLTTTIASINSPTSIELAAPAATTVASNVRYAYGTDDFAAFDNALGYIAQIGGGTVNVPRGNFLLSATIKSGSDTTLNLDKGAVLHKAHPDSFFSNGRGYNTSSDIAAYAGNGNIQVIGGVWEGYSAGVYDSYTTLALGFGTNITIRDAIFRDGIGGGHFVDMSVCDNVEFSRCRFEGFALNTGGDSTSDAIQLDHNVSPSFPYFGLYKGKPNKNIVVRRCYFGPNPLNTDPNFGSVYTGVGSHGAVQDEYAQNILVEGCTFDDPQYAGVRPWKWKNATITKNDFVNSTGRCIHVTATAAGSESSKDINGVQTNQAQAGDGLTITENLFEGFTTCIIFTDVQVGTTTSIRHENIIIGANQFKNGSDDCIDARAVRNLTILPNSYKNVSRIIITQGLECENVVIQGGNGEDFSNTTAAITLNLTNGFSITGGVYKNMQARTVLVTGACRNGKISDVTQIDFGLGSNQSGIVAQSSSDNISIAGIVSIKINSTNTSPDLLATSTANNVDILDPVSNTGNAPLLHQSPGGVAKLRGTGSPEGVITARIGSQFMRTDGGASTTLYVKTSGTGNTGWTAK